MKLSCRVQALRSRDLIREMQKRGFRLMDFRYVGVGTEWHLDFDMLEAADTGLESTVERERRNPLRRPRLDRLEEQDPAAPHKAGASARPLY